MNRVICYDTEFLEDGLTIAPISIGMVDESGAEYYAIFNDIPRARVSDRPWVMLNVVQHLPVSDRTLELIERHRTVNPDGNDVPGPNMIFDLDMSHPDVKPRAQIREEVRDFITRDLDNPSALWAWYGAYDHVLLAQIFGRMIELPVGVPMFTHELVQLWEDAGYPEKPAKPIDQHDALADARWDLELYRVCRKAMGQ